MISKILEIDSFGLFDGFRWESGISEFKKYNVFYGWNYSGKTTLSRVLSNFEDSQKHPDYPTCSSKILDGDGAHYDCESWGYPHPIKVFNIDFIETNLKWDAQIEPILFIGEENIKLQKELKTLREQEELKNKDIKDTSTKAQSIESNIDGKTTDKARQIKNILSIPNYNKRNLLPVIQEIRQTPQLLDEESLKNQIDTYRSTDKKPQISLMPVPVYNIDELKSKVKDLLQTKVVSKTIQKLQDDPGLGVWVRQGKDIHAGKDICEFCGNRLPFDLIDKLNDHFSDEYERHIEVLNNAIGELKSKSITIPFVDVARLYGEFANEYFALKSEAESQISIYNENLKTLIAALCEKIKNPFNALDLPPIKKGDYISQPINRINEIINKHNKISDSFEARKKQALSLLEKHFASEFISVYKYFEMIDEASKLREDVNKLQSQARSIGTKCNEIERKLSETVKGAEKVNEYLQSFWGRNDIEIKATEEDTFQLYRGPMLAKNLSEGEKTAISFAYFITKLEEKGADLSKTIVYIDDPVSSLDSNHLFSTYSFIKNRLNGAHQLFLSTHNFELLNLLKDWLKDKKYKNKSSFYLVERCEDNGSFCACISNMPKELEKFKSEFHYLFSILYNFHSRPVSDHNKLYLLPNLARRFLEAYLGFKIPIHKGLHSKLKYFIHDVTTEDKIIKFLDQYSHNNALPRSLMFPNFSECKECMAIIIDHMQLFDLDHFNYLVDEVANN